MSKRNSDGEVLFNRFNLALANSQRRLASLLGPEPESHAATTISKPDEEDEDLKKDFADPEQLGVGGIRPKDIEDGSFTKRTLTSTDKLLEQLIGKKKAKAHLAAKQQTTRLGAQPQPKHGRSYAVKKEESEDEEEGRAAAFKSKRQRVEKPKQPATKHKEDDSMEETAGVAVANVVAANTEEQKKEEERTPIEKVEDGDVPSIAAKPIPSRRKAKPTSYLDEILAERSKKKKNKKSAVEA